jgi:actin related protein 2/3 complex subunit 5
MNTSVVAECLLRIKDIPSTLKSLDSNELHTLLKYIYKAMASPEAYSSSVLLQWHEKTIEICGVGAIVRVLTDIKSV